MKPAAIAATLLLHTAPLVAVYQIQSTTPAMHQGKTALSVHILQGNEAPRTSLASQQAAARPSPAIASQNETAPPNRAHSSKKGAYQQDGLEVSGRKNVSIPADYAANNQKPQYPLLAIKQEEQGTVVLRILVKADGTPGEVRLQRSSGHPLLDQSALAAVRQWRFQPATVNRQPVAEWYQLAIPFQLRQ